ncbi:MAG: response regulator [Anaerolineae bacterium]
MSRLRVLIVDDHALFREGIRLILQGEANIEVVGEAADGQAAIDAVQALEPDVVLMDVTMPEMGGLEAARQIKRGFPESQVLMLTMHESDDYFFRSLSAGASGYVLKEAVSADLITAIQAVGQGQVFLYPSVAKKLVADYLGRVNTAEAQDKYERLTPREREILLLIGEGHSDKEIAERLVISANTVQSHRWRIMDKLDLRNRAELIKYAIRRGLIDIYN